MQTLNAVAANLSSLDAEIVEREALYMATYDCVLAGEAAGEDDIVARLDMWLTVDQEILCSLRASRHILETKYNAMLAESEPEPPTTGGAAGMPEECPAAPEPPSACPYTLAQARYILSHTYCVLCVPADSEDGFATHWFPGLCIGECRTCADHRGPDLGSGSF